MPQEPIRLEQTTGLFEHVTLDIRQDELHCTYSEILRGTLRWHIPLARLDRNTMESWSRSRWGLFAGLLLIGIACAILTFGTLPIYRNDTTDKVLIGSAIMIAILCIPGIALVIFSWLRIRRQIFLFDRYEGKIVVAIRADRPSPSQVQKFLEALINEVRKFPDEESKEANEVRGRLDAADEIRRLYELRLQGTLNDDEFLQGRSTILRPALAIDSGLRDPQITCAKLAQRHGLAKREFTLYSNRLQMTTYGVTSGVRRFVYFKFINDEPDLCRRSAGALALLVLAGALIFIAITVGMGLRPLSATDLGALVLFGYLPAAFMLVVAALSGRKVWVCSYKRWQQGVQPDIWIKPGAPSRQAVDAFLEKLRELHLAWQEHRKSLNAAGPEESVACALGKFAQLARDGIVSETEFTAIKEHLLQRLSVRQPPV